MPRFFYSVLSIATCAITLSSFAAEWTQFRGPDGNGHTSATGLPLKWTDTVNVIWKEAVPGEGWSSPVVSGDTIYLTAAIPVDGSTDQSLRLLSFNAKTGVPSGSVEIFLQDGETTPRIHKKNSHARVC